MPIYVYQCQCGETREVIHAMGDKPEVECLSCRGPMTRALAAPNIQFKGSGFYSTDKKK